MENLSSLLESMQRGLYGWTKADAHALSLCIKCRSLAAPKCHTKEDTREYLISGLCGECFEAITKDPEEDK
jgi:hypothetical protein